MTKKIIIGIFVLLALILIPQAASANLQDDAISYYRFDDLSDSIGTNDLTTNSSVTKDTGLLGSSFYFDGSNSYVQDPTFSGITSTNSFSTSLWYKQDNVNKKYLLTFRNSGASVAHAISYRDNTADLLRTYISDGTLAGGYSNTTITDTSDYIHVVTTYDKNNLLLYQNNVLVLNTSTTKTPYSFQNLMLGSLSDGYSDDLIGNIDEVVIWDKTLTKEEINFLYNNGNGYTGFYDDIISFSAINNISKQEVNTFNVSLYYEDGTLYETKTTTNGIIEYNLTGEPEENYTAYFYGQDLKTVNTTINFLSDSEQVVFESNPTPSVSVNFYNELTLNLIDDRTVYLELWNDYESHNITTTDGTIFKELSSGGDYIASFYAENYTRKYYYFNLANDDAKNLNFYLSSQTLSNVTATIQDQNLNELEGATLIIEKHNINNGNYLISERINTDFEGKARFKALLYEAFYRFKIYYAGELVFSSSPTTIKSEEINFIITITDGVTQGFNDILDIDYLHYFDDVNNRFVFTYSNVKGTVTGINLYTHRVTSKGETLTDTTSQSSASGTIYHNVNNITGYTYKNCAYGIIEDNTEELISCETVEFDTEINEESQQLAIFWLLIITILFAMAALYNVTVGLIITPIPFIAFEILGLTTLGLPYAISIEVLFIVVALMINK